MDVRTYRRQLMDADEDDGDRQRRKVYFSPAPVDDDLQEMLARHAPSQARQQADMALFNWGIAAWQRDSSDRIDASAWRERLAEARQRTADETEITDLARGGPGFVAAVCIRDHWQEMMLEDCDWCVNMLIGEIERDCDSEDMSVRVSRYSLSPSRPAAYVLPKVLCEKCTCRA